ncbi:hypothetical protein JGH11_08565 [Dysgonomonas sp. Marseille-P4677]|uniref:outer membrane beta-barrel protein n=1 Tax=Dysgonomonas sp. Marseille-P4677 TaxID=2364790 RepID=UPI0019143E55|nr:outer membrane beta-barrel protein [Dysgonomonas sp. Marseille-P4677]MBK5720921.1 hypothetical protein [Dysgonomonas sp. Marseille-P4677]
MTKIGILAGILLLSILSLSAQDDKNIENEVDSVSVKKSVSTPTALKEIAKNVYFSAYFQGQYQSGQKDVNRLMVGSANENYGKSSFNRFGLRRAFLSTMFETGIVYGLVTIEVKDNKNIWFSDAYLNITEPWSKKFSLTLGSLNTLFGYELSVSPSVYELIEGTSFLYSLFPDIYDVGAQVSYKAPEKYGSLNVNLGLVAGNGVQQETDSKRDFVGSISASTNKNRPFRLSGGLAYYNGFVYQGNENVYKMKEKAFFLDNNVNNKGQYAKRRYFDVNAQLAVETLFGLSQLRCEYVKGTQPAGKDSYNSPNSSKRPETDTYIRDFNGGYIYYLQQIGPKLPLTFWGGYSWHDPNTDVSGADIGKYNTNETDISYQTVSLGLVWFPYPAIRVQAFYEMPINEKSINLAEQGYNRNRNDNVFSFRIQYKY